MNEPPKIDATQMLQQLRLTLQQLKLTKISELLDVELDRVDKGLSSALETLHRLVQAQWHYQLERRIERRIRESKLKERKTLIEFDFDFQPGLDRNQIMELMTMGFAHRRQGVILAGNSGTGKSHIAKALALEGCKQDLRVRYTTAAEMLKVLYAALADDSLEQKLKHYLNPQLLVVDELGFDRLEQEDARNAALFFKIIDGRYNNNSTVVTTNIDFKQLGHYLGDPVVTTAIVDRMVHHSTVINIKGPSWRLKESKKLNQRQKTKQSKPTKKDGAKRTASKKQIKSRPNKTKKENKQ